MESGHGSGGGASPRAGAEGASGGGGGGLLCHACGYQYPNAHPSAKHRRAHRKHCGKPASATAAGEDGAWERDGRELLLGEGGGGRTGDGFGATAEECGGGVPGSVQEAGNAAEDGDNNAEHSSEDGAGAQVIVEKYAENRLVSSSGVPSKITPEVNTADNGDTLAEVGTQYSGKASVLEDRGSSGPAPSVSAEQLQDGSVLVLPSELANGEGSSPEISVCGIQNSNVVPPESDTARDGISEQANDLVTQPTGIAVTELDGEFNTIGKDLPGDENSLKGSEFDISCQEMLQTKTGDEHSTIAVEADPSDKNLDAVLSEEIPNDETESNQQSNSTLTSSIEQVSSIEEPVKSCAQISAGTDDYNCDDLQKFETGGCHSEATDTVKLQQPPDSTSVTTDHLAISKQADIVEGQHYPNTDGGIQVVPTVIVPAIGAKVVSDGTAPNITENVCSSAITMGDSMRKNVTCGTDMPSQVEPLVLSTCVTGRETNMVGSTNYVDEKRKNEKFSADLTSHELNEMHDTEKFEGKQQNKGVIAHPISHETNADSNVENYLENEQNEDIIAETSSCKISAVQSTSSIEEKEQIEEFIANLASEKINVASSRDIADEKQGEVDVKAKCKTNVVCSIETIGESIAASSEINAGAATQNVEDKMESEEVMTGLSNNIVCSSINEEKMHNEEITKRIVVHGADDVKEKTYEETTADPTSHEKFIVVTSTNSVEERKDEETTADLTSDGINAACTTDSVEEKNGEPILDSSKINTVGSIGDVEGTKQYEETTADPISGENSTPPLPAGSDDAIHKKQNGSTTINPASDKTEVAQVNDVQETEKTEEIAIQSTNDLRENDKNEEIADKEMVTDSERSHVSLKVLLADKNVETKEKKTSTKDRVLSFRRRGAKDNVSPVKPGSPKASAEQQDWNSPARLPVEKKLKGKKQQWVPFICCSSIQ